jgi:hypothetical protein
MSFVEQDHSSKHFFSTSRSLETADPELLTCFAGSRCHLRETGCSSSIRLQNSLAIAFTARMNRRKIHDDLISQQI